MKRSLIILSFLLGILSAAVPAFAHHSFSSEFDINQPVKLVGVLTKLDWVNPHGFIYLDVKRSEGKGGLPIANGRTITLADGRSLFAGSSGPGAPRDNADPTEPQY